uniref:Uncharacterized protein n=1 Tax=Podoviridae sp. ct8Lf7 TaxID=2827723 RepID=A0A8S5S020_9CAUD|nr:MAG TPA: hypothetical protein [Podoviridae sp. ct8Lf7]
MFLPKLIISLTISKVGTILTSSFIYFSGFCKPIWIEIKTMCFVDRSISCYFVR